MKLAIVGSRTFTDYGKLVDIISKLPTTESFSEIVSGGARGTDTLAEQYADNYGIPKIIFKADWDKYGKSAGYRRNVDIVNYCDYLIAFWDGESKGTQHSIDLANKQNKLLKIIRI
jgi:hypothetical protein